MFEPGYIGGKGYEGGYQAIIGQMPPHSVYVEPFFGSGAIFWKKRRAEASILIDIDASTISKVGAVAGVNARVGNALDLLPTLTLPPDAVVYCDPPYPLSTRKGRAYYRHEMTDAQHELLLAILARLNCRVLISSYANPLYIEKLRGWRCVQFMGVTRAGRREETLWCNFPEPKELHDWRFAGRDCRQRVHFGRMRDRWLAKLARMAPLKRNFLLAALASADNAGNGAGIRKKLILSLFPGIDLLGRGFEAEGYSVVRGPDTLWGQDVRGFHPDCHLYEGVIGGSPCQNYSKANREPSPEDGDNLVHEFTRCVTAAQPLWFLLENVPGVPNLTVPGYRVQRFNLNANECGGEQNRLRTFQFGSRDRSVLVIHRGEKSAVPSQPCCMASEGERSGARDWGTFCELQGLPRDFALPGWSKAAKYRAVGNGVPVYMARAIAAAIRDRRVTGTVHLCICECGREVPVGRTMATPACRKRMQRRRDAAGVTRPSLVTPAQSQLL